MSDIQYINITKHHEVTQYPFLHKKLTTLYIFCRHRGSMKQ